MAKILRGKRKGEDVKIHQFCNDWFSLDDGTIINPTSLEFTQDEIEEIETAADKDQTGMMFAWFEWEGNRLIRKRYN